MPATRSCSGQETSALRLHRVGQGLSPPNARTCSAHENRGAHVYFPRGDQDYAITAGLRMLTLRRLITEANGLYAADVRELPLLAYYASSVAHLFGRLAETWPAASSAGGTSSRPAAEGLRALARRIIPL